MRRTLCLILSLVATPAFSFSIDPIAATPPATPDGVAMQAGNAVPGSKGRVSQAPYWKPRSNSPSANPPSEERRGTIVVTSCAGSGAGTLAAAISTANSSGGNLVITFDSSLSGCVIQPTGPLPILTATNVTIDGDLNDDGVPDITVDGSSAGALEEGIFLGGCVGVTIRGLTVRDFYLGFAAVAGGSNDIVDCVATNNAWGVIFAQSSGNLVIRTRATQNSITGIQFQESSSGNIVTDCLVDGNPGIGMVAISGPTSTTLGPDNIVVGNGSTGIAMQGLTGTQVHGNYIGLLPDGTAIGNLGDGVGLAIAVFNTNIYDNVISGNGLSGVLVSETGSQNNFIQDNLIGLDPTGVSARANGTFGVAIAEESIATTVGPNNIISGNVQAGVFVGGPTSGNVVKNNVIGLDAARLSAVPNGLVGVIFQTGTSANILGPDNLIAGNSTHGALAVGAGTTVELLNGRIGVSADDSAVPNVGHGLFVADEAVATVTENVHVNGNTLFATVRVEGDARLELAGGAARLTVGGDAALGRATLPGPSAPVVDLLAGTTDHDPGTLELDGGVVLADAVATYPGANEAESGRLRGGGVVEAALLNNDGIVAIDGDFISADATWDAQLWLKGDYAQGAGGVLEAALKPQMVRGGPLPQGTALLVQAGALSDATFAGTCRYTQSAFTPSLNDVYTVAAYAGNTGVHDVIQGSVVDADDAYWLASVYEENTGLSQSLAAIVMPAPLLRNGSPLTGETGSGEQLTVVTHGTISDATTWVQDIADGMSDGLNPVHGAWDVTSFDWSGFSTNQPINTAEIAYQFGRSMAHWLVESDLLYDAVHLLGHSSGSWIPDGFSDVWRVVHPTGWTHITGWDAFNPVLLDAPGLPNPVWGDNADYASHFFNADKVAGTNSIFANAVNFNVTNVALGTFDVSAQHGWPYNWYLETILTAPAPPIGSFVFGYPYTYEYRGAQPGYADILQQGEQIVIPVDIPVFPDPGGLYVAGDPVWQPPLDFAGLTLVPGPEGTVIVNPDGSLSLTTGPGGTVYVDADVAFVEDANLFRSGLRFMTAESGSLSVVVSGTMTVLVADEAAINAESDSTGTGIFRWLDSTPAGARTVRWTLDARDGGTSTVTLYDFQVGLEGFEDVSSVEWPDGVSYEGTSRLQFGVGAAVPNPFDGRTEITLDLPDSGPVSARIFDVQGGLVATLVDEVLPAGRFTVSWDGTSDRGRETSPGVYFYRVEAEAGVRSGRLVRVQ